MPQEIFEKPKRKRKPLTEEQKAVLVERLRKAREAKKSKKNNVEIKVEEKDKGLETIKEEPKVVPQDMPVKAAPKAKAKRLTKAEKSAREKSLELQSMRDELELQQLRNQLDELKRPKKSPPKVEEKEPTETEPKPKASVKEPKVAEKVIEPPKVSQEPLPIKHRYAPTSVWSMF
tara:strand:- start:19 stop:543 length:525 start_codon:yes stop_codon:yes gene_type:complete